MKRLKAFTLMELIIGMIIGSIVVGFCYTGYRMILIQFMDFKKTKAQINEAMLFNSALTHDFVESSFIEYKDNRLFLMWDSTKIEYEFTQEYVLRNVSEVVDTFHFEPKEINPVFFAESQAGLSAILKDFSFNAIVLGEKERFYYSKDYSAEYLMGYQKKSSDGN